MTITEKQARRRAKFRNIMWGVIGILGAAGAGKEAWERLQ